VPVLLFPSDLFANRLPDPVLQQLEHPSEQDVTVNDAFRSVSRFFARVHRPEQLLAALPEAMRVLTDPVETGAVTVALPEDVQTEAFQWPASFFEPRTWHVRRPVPEPEAVAAAASLLRTAKRPLIVTGGGTLYARAHEALRAFVERYRVPVVETQAGKGALPWDHPMNAGPVGANGGLAANRLAATADVVLCVGTRLGDFATASMTAFAHPEVHFIGLNVVPMDAHKLGAVALAADARRGLEALFAALEGWDGTRAEYQDEVRDLKAEWDAIVDDLRRGAAGARPSQAAVMGVVNEAVGGGATVINAAGSMPGDLLKLWRSSDPKAYHVEYGYSCMGYEIPAGLGVKLAEPGREVVVFVGDGTYLMMNSEIVTAVAEGLAFTIVLVDNHGYQSIHGLQRSVGSPSFINELRHRDPVSGRTDGPTVAVDFALHAEAMGALALEAHDLDGLREALEVARASDRVAVIVVRTDPEQRVPGFEGWWDVPVAEVSEQASVREARAAYQAQALRQRRYTASPTRSDAAGGETEETT